MHVSWGHLATAALALHVDGALATGISSELSAELQMGWRLGLRPRQQAAQNLQFFQGAIGGAAAPAISQSDDSERPFEVEGDTFVSKTWNDGDEDGSGKKQTANLRRRGVQDDFASAADRACDDQKNACAESANQGADHEVGDCDGQNDECKAGIATATRTSFDGDGADGGGDIPDVVEEGGNDRVEEPEQALVSSDANFDYFCDL